MKKLIFILFISTLTNIALGQTDTAKYYKLSDTTFWIGKTYLLPDVLWYLSGPCINYGLDMKPLDSVISFLIKNPELIVEIGYHTDDRPIPFTNDTLSLCRAKSIRAYFIENGISSERVLAFGYGSGQPRIIYENTTYTFDKTPFTKCIEAIVFLKNTVLDKKFINSQHDICTKEAAHRFNNRIEMKIIKIE